MRCPTKADHRVLLGWLIGRPADEVGVFVCPEATEPQDHVFRIEGGCNHAHAVCEPLDKELRLVGIADGQFINSWFDSQVGKRS